MTEIRMNLIIKIFIIIMFCDHSFSENILFANPLPSRSHFIWTNTIIQELLKKGHNITVLDFFADTVPKSTNFHQITIKEDLEKLFPLPKDFTELSSLGPIENIRLMGEFSAVVCPIWLQHPNFQLIMNYPEDFSFDLIVLDLSIGYCYLPLVQKFKYPPTIAITPFLLPQELSFDFGNHIYPGYVPWFGYKTDEDMTFYQRFWNHVYTYYELYYKIFDTKKRNEEDARKLLKIDLDPFEKMEKHISLLLSNTDPILDKPQPLPPNIIAVGGLHAKPSKKLSQDIEEIMSGAKHGVIVFSLGTNVRSDQLSKKIIQVFLKAFKELKQTVIWKFESDLTDLPQNVFVKKWLPQNDALGHPNTVLFIGHGGALSTQEAVYHGIPVLAVPFIFDQHINAQSLKLKNRGDILDIKTVTVEVLLEKINNLLNNPIYASTMKEASRKFRDYPVTPLKNAISWIEYSMRNNGTHFLNPKSRNLPFIVISSLDILLFILISLGMLLWVSKICLSSLQKKKKYKKN